MSFNIDTFKGEFGLQYGGSRPSLFKVVIDFPNITAADYTTDKSLLINKFSNLCHVSTLPGTRTNTPVKISYLGRQFNFAGDKTYESFQTTVYNDEDFLIRNHLELWLEKINSTSFMDNSLKDNYKVDITVEQYSKKGKKIKDYKLINCFPTSIGEIPLDFSSQGISDFVIQWSYDYFTTSYYDATFGSEKKLIKV